MTHPSDHRPEMASILECIGNMRFQLQELAISIIRPSESDWHTAEGRWSKAIRNLDTALRSAEFMNDELRRALYKKAIEGCAARGDKPAELTELVAKAALHGKIKLALAFIKEKGPVKGVLIARKIEVSEARFRSHYVPKLRALGVRNDRHGDGYYLPEG